jgi:hypothetical protein
MSSICLRIAKRVQHCGSCVLGIRNPSLKSGVHVSSHESTYLATIWPVSPNVSLSVKPSAMAEVELPRLCQTERNNLEHINRG